MANAIIEQNYGDVLGYQRNCGTHAVPFVALLLNCRFSFFPLTIKTLVTTAEADPARHMTFTHISKFGNDRIEQRSPRYIQWLSTRRIVL